MGVVAQKLTVFLIESFAQICRKLAAGLLSIVSNLVNDTLKWIGEKLADLKWWQKLAALVGGMIVGGVSVALGATLAVSAGASVGSTVLIGLLMLLL